MAKGHKQGNLFTLEEGKIEAYIATKAQEVPSKIWHARLGYHNYAFLKSLENNKVINVSNSIAKDISYTSYKLGKHCKLSFNKSITTTSFLLEKIHSDLWGPTPLIST